MRSPTTKTSGWVASEQSGWTLTLPALSTSAPAAWASIFAQAGGAGAGRPHLGGGVDALGRAVASA